MGKLVHAWHGACMVAWQSAVGCGHVDSREVFHFSVEYPVVIKNIKLKFLYATNRSYYAILKIAKLQNCKIAVKLYNFQFSNNFSIF